MEEPLSSIVRMQRLTRVEDKGPSEEMDEKPVVVEYSESSFVVGQRVGILKRNSSSVHKTGLSIRSAKTMPH
jgi:hypothetical protein